MTRLAVMAHYDPRGALGPHVRRQVSLLAEAVDDLVVVTTAQLTDRARRFLSSKARLVERSNFGYDFFSYKVGLDLYDLTRYDEVTVCNDSCVAPLTDYPTVYSSMADRAVDFWGYTHSDRITHHVQSFFVTFRPWLIESAAFGHFWATLEPLSDRGRVIKRHEVGLSTTLYDAGFGSGSFFTETPDDRRLARRRVQWWAARRSGLPRGRYDLGVLRERLAEPWNPSTGLADAALDGGRLPYVKFDVLRYDPYGLGAGQLLDLCEERFPDEFDGVRDYLKATAQFYPPRAHEILPPVSPALRPLRPLVEYRRAA